ncbi:MAG: XdhC family protein [Persicimonas sp.]
MALLDDILNAYEFGEDAVLGTVVDLEGSGYRRPGARILIRTDGSHVGLISGGCLEKDVARHARARVADGPKTVTLDTRSNRLQPLGAYGTGCEGILRVLLQQLPVPAGRLDPLERLARLREAGEPGVLATVYDTTDSLNRTLGRAALVTDHDAHWDPEFGPELRGPLLEEAERTLGAQATRGLRLEVGGAALSVLLEYVAPPVELVIVGDGRDAAALVELAVQMDWRVRVVGADPLRLEASRFEEADTVCLEHPGDITSLELHRHSYVVQMTHDFQRDARMLPGLLDSQAPYIGLLGPKRRAGRLMSALHERGQLPDTSKLDKLAAPVGLDLGGDDPLEVALSIISQVVAAKNGRRGAPLCEREDGIHDRHFVDEHSVDENRVDHRQQRADRAAKGA